MAIAVQLHQAGRLRKAQSLYQQVLRIQPDNADALHLSGLANHQLGIHEEAYALIGRAIAANPSAAPFHNNLGEVCRALNRMDEALACYEKALALDATLAEAHRNIGLARLANGETERAIAGLRAAMARFPDSLGIHWVLGQALMQRQLPHEAIEIYDAGLAKAPTDPTLLCAKGIALKAAGRKGDAMRHYRHAIGAQPHVPELHHNLALLHMEQNDTEQAIAHLENEIRLDPRTESARHLLAALRNTTTDRAPAAYVRETFDAYADGFDHHLTGKLGYRTPNLLATLLRETLADARERMLNVIDLGCGTGLFGEELRGIKKRLAGIDLSPRMIEKARARGIYDELIVADLLDHLAGIDPGRFDLVAATDVFNYLGDLLPVFREASRILDAGGWFAFSVEAPPPESGDFTLAHTGRYQHNRHYVSRLITQFGFSQAGFAEASLREEHGEPVAGYLYVLSRA